MRALILSILILSITPVMASPNVRELADGAKPPPGKIDSLSWMPGRWMGEAFGGQVEENFSPAVGGVMVGHFRSSQDGKDSFYELETVGEENGTLVFRVKHFNPDLHGWEDKDKTVDFPLVAIESDRVYFSGLTIEKLGPDAQRHYIALKDKKTGGRREVIINYTRAK